MASLENFRLTVFRAVAAHLSFRKAADELYLTQPAVSLQIKALEEELAVPLFDRSGAHVSLTAAGQVLLRHALASHATLAAAQGEIAALSGTQAGALPLGASTTVAQYVLPALLGEFQRKNPRVALTLLSGNTEHVVDALRDHTILLGLIEGPPHSREVRIEPFLPDELVLILPSAHDWAERTSIPPADLATVPLLLRERGSGTRQVVEEALEHAGLKRSSLRVSMELDSTESIKSAVEAGLGIGFVSRWALVKDARFGTTLKTLPVEGLRIRRDFLIALPAGPEPHGAAGEFRRFLLNHPGLNAARKSRENPIHTAHKQRK